MDCAKEAEILDEEQINQLLDLFVANCPIYGESAWKKKACDDNACLKSG